MLATTLAVVPQFRDGIKSWVFSKERVILAKTSGHVTSEGLLVSVFKIRQDGFLKIEIFRMDAKSSESTLMQVIDLPETRDGYINFQGNATNLALSDTDGDGAMDIIAPTYDDQMTPRLNVFRFNQTLSVFERATSPE